MALTGPIALAACGGHGTAASSPGASGTPGAVPSVRLQGTATQRVGSWFSNGGQAALTRLAAAALGIAQAQHAPATLGADCAKLAAAVASAQAGSPVPDAAAQASFSSALSEFATGAADCRKGASSHDSALLTKTAGAISAGTTDIRRFDAETEDAQTKQVRAREASHCKQLYQSWEHGSAHTEISQFLSALGALMSTDSGTDLSATATAAEKAARPAAPLTRLPVPACADPANTLAQILATVRTAAASARAAKSRSAMTRALAPLKGVPSLEAAFTAEVKTATGT
jgi:negative regulator of replication initiation